MASAQSPSSLAHRAMAQERLALLAIDKERWTEAENLLLDSIAIRTEAGLTADANFAGVLDRLAGIYISQGKIVEASSLLMRAIPIMETVFYAAHGSVGPLLEHLGDCLLAENKLSEAEPLYKRASDIFASSVTLENRLALRSLYKLGKLYLALGRPADAKGTLTKGMKYVDTPLGPVAEFRYQLALAALMLGEKVEARSLLQDAAADFKQRSNYARVGDCSDSLATICSSSGDSGGADEWMRQSGHYKALAVKAPYPQDIFLATLLRA